MSIKPQWLKVSRAASQNSRTVEGLIKNLKLNTVCKEASCPNYSECFSKKTATFMILGKDCTRNCRFCNVNCGEPSAVDSEEPANAALAVKALQLKYVVITSVTRDDLPDGGAWHFAKTVSEIKKHSPETAIETLIPDFQGNTDALKTVINSFPDVVSHNIETVAALYLDVRPQAEYRRSLQVIKNIKTFNPQIRSKTGLMLGLGETEKQVFELFDDLREAGCEFLTIGQYLAPSRNHFPVKEYIKPERFDKYAAEAKARGFEFVAAGPLVRSSYHAGEALGFD